MARGHWIVAGVVIAIAGCKGGTQHCKDGTGASLTRCIETSGTTGLGVIANAGTGLVFSALCSAIGSKPALGECPEEGRVGGCLDTSDAGFRTIEWTYEGTIDDVTCGGDEVRVGPDGDEVEDVDPGTPSACSTDGGPAVDVTFTNARAGAVSLLWVDTACVEHLYTTVEPGASHAQSTFDGHVWIARAGTSGTGRLVWERMVTGADADATLTIE